MSNTPRTDEHLRMKEENGHAVIVSRDFARQLETELADKEKQLAEITRQRNAYKKALEISEDKLMAARAEIERLNNECNKLDTECNGLAARLKGARAEIKLKNEELDMFLAEQQAMGEIIERKDKLIEQMVGALNHCKSTFEDYVKIHKAKMPVVTIGPIPPNWGDMQRKIARNQEAFDLCKAALSAAERGE